MPAIPPDWYPDPEGRHQYRYWDGTEWTTTVADNGRSSTESMTQPQSDPAVTPDSSIVQPDSTSLVSGTESPTHPMDEAAIDPNGPAGKAAKYAAACKAVSEATNATIETANRAAGSRTMASDMSSHEMSRKNFATYAEQYEAEFVPLYRNFVQARQDALHAGTEYLQACSGNTSNAELFLIVNLDEDTYSRTSVAGHILRGDFRASPAGFLNGLRDVNTAIQEDIFSFGEAGFIGVVVGQPVAVAPTERDCPWCAETIKAAAIVCRFCNRDVEPVSHP